MNKRLFILATFLLTYTVYSLAQDFNNPVIKSCVPSQLKVSNEKKTIEIILNGEHMNVGNSDRKWEARDMQVWVKRAEQKDWTLLYDNLRGSEYVEKTSWAHGSVGNKYSEWINLELATNVWCKTAGVVEIKILKGKWKGSPYTENITVHATSNIFKIPVVTRPSYRVSVSDIMPGFITKDSPKDQKLVIRGEFSWGTKVYIDGNTVEPKYLNANYKTIEIDFPFTKHKQHFVRLVDPQNVFSEYAEFWELEKSVLKETKPASVNAGQKTEQPVTISLLTPGISKVELRIAHVISSAQPSKTVSASPVLITPAANDKDSPGKDPGINDNPSDPLNKWMQLNSLYYSTGKKGLITTITLQLEPEWLNKAGTATVRITTAIGVAETSFKIAEKRNELIKPLKNVPLNKNVPVNKNDPVIKN